MKYSRQNFFSNTAIALSAFLSFTLLACSESTPTNADEPIAYSEPAPGASSALESSSSVVAMSSPAPESSSIASSSSEKNSVSPIEDMYSRCNTTLGIITDDCFSSKCDAENEGKVETKWIGNAKYGGNSYFRCEKGSWVKGDIRLTCDTAGVQVGDICTKGPKLGIFAAMNSIPGSNTLRFIYKGDGVWKEFDPEKNMVADIEKLGKQCTAETKGDKGILEYGHGENSVVVFYGCDGVAWRSINPDAYYCTNANSVEGDTCAFELYGNVLHYVFIKGVWRYMSKEEVQCGLKNHVVGDTCSFESDGEMNHYIYKGYDSYYTPIWVECNLDPVLGCCPINYNLDLHRESDGKKYYCKEGEWLEELEDADTTPAE